MHEVGRFFKQNSRLYNRSFFWARFYVHVLSWWFCWNINIQSIPLEKLMKQFAYIANIIIDTFSRIYFLDKWWVWQIDLILTFVEWLYLFFMWLNQKVHCGKYLSTYANTLWILNFEAIKQTPVQILYVLIWARCRSSHSLRPKWQFNWQFSTHYMQECFRDPVESGRI